MDVSSFGDRIDEAVVNLKEAGHSYLEDEQGKTELHDIGDALIGENAIKT